jgi:anti-anti-sigma regulatory factor
VSNFVAETKGESPSLFLRTLDDILSQTVQTGASMDVWHSVVSILREYTWAHLEGVALLKAEDLCHQARIITAQAAERACGYHYTQKEQYTQMLRDVEASLITTFDIDGLMNVLAQRLSDLAVESVYLSLYETPRQSREWARLLLAYSDKEHFELPAGGLRFRSDELIPAKFLPQGRPYALVLESLFFGSDLLGFMLFELGTRDASVSHVLRIDIGSALQGAVLLRAREEAEHALEQAYAEMEQQVVERTAQLQQETAERERLQQEVIEAQKRAIQELSTPIIPVLEGVIVMPLIGSIDTLRARDVTRSLLMGIHDHKAKVVILDITGVPIVDSGVAAYLNKTIQAARLKGARTIVTGVSEAVAETIVDLGIDWSGIETLSDLQTGLKAAMAGMGQRINR